MRMFIYCRAAVFGGVLGFFVVTLKAELASIDSARMVSSDGAVSNIPERRYATKNMLTLAQNEQPAEVKEVPSVVIPEALTADQKQLPEAGSGLASAGQELSVSTESLSTGDQKPVLVKSDAVVQSPPEITAPVSVPDVSAAASVVPVATSATDSSVAASAAAAAAVPAETVVPVTAPAEVLLAEPEAPKKEEKKPERNGNGVKRTNGSDLIGIDTINIDEPEGNWLYK
ncbi:MAG: hypothetical protein U1E13_08475, partial [Methylophilaceae bacterium]|nr:hypothetical protein [Methylophilaceae bacterium]